MPPILSLRHYGHEQIVHSHSHTQLVFGLNGQLDFEIDGRGSRIQQQLLAVVPSDVRHACGSARGSQCLVLDIPDGRWLQQRLGHHGESGRRLLEEPAALRLTPRKISWSAGWRPVRSMIRSSANKAPSSCWPASPAVASLSHAAVSCHLLRSMPMSTAIWPIRSRSRILRGWPGCRFLAFMHASSAKRA